MNQGIIYIITNRINGKKYIGQTRQPLHQRWNQHVKDYRNHNYLINNAIRKYKPENFSMESIETITENDENILVSKLNELEIKYIKENETFVDWNKGGYNLTTGGMCHILSKQSREKVRRSLIGKPKSECTKQKISQSLKGRKVSENVIKNMVKTFQITFSNGKTETIKGLKRFCREKNYDFRCLLRLKNNEVFHHKDIVKIKKIS